MRDVRVVTEPSKEKAWRVAQETEGTIVVVHSGVFHAHDVFGAMLLKPSLVIRTRDMDIIETLSELIDTYIFDVGGKAEGNWLDHHQYRGYRGLPQMFFEESYAKADKSQLRLLESIARPDCGESDTDYARLSVSSFNLTWMDDQSNEAWSEAFLKAMKFAEAYWNNAEVMMSATIATLKRIDSRNVAKEKIELKASRVKNGVLVLNKFIPYDEGVRLHNAKNEQTIYFIVFPEIGDGGGWMLRAVPIPTDRFTNYFNIDISGFEDECTFLHKGKFIAGFKNKKSAIACGERIIGNKK